jgi:hypothetical protein
MKQGLLIEGQLSHFGKLVDQKDQFEVPYLPYRIVEEENGANIARCR